MITKVNTFKLNGIYSVPVAIETEIRPGIGIHLVGLADNSVKESLLRTVTALQSLGYNIPGKRITINLAPMDLHKSGSGYDLPIALGILSAAGQEPLPDLDKYVIAGELGLDGCLRDIPGYVQCAQIASKSGKCCILPTESAKKAALAMQGEVTIYGADDLREVIDILNDGAPEWTALDDAMAEEPDPEEATEPTRKTWDSLNGHEAEKRALEIAAAGGHPILMVGAPGSGKGLLALALLDILPPMNDREAMEVQEVYASIGKQIAPGVRPFRAPHYAASLAALIGGGADVLPGEVSLAHNGVLFFDECTQAPKVLMEAVRAPLEDKMVTISRLKGKVNFPADFFPIFATDPCPCGYYGEGDRCTCTPGQRARFLSRLSGPVYDMLTMQLWVHTPETGAPSGDTADVVAERVRKAREIQYARQNKLNDELSTSSLDTIARLDDECREFMERIIAREGLSARAYTRVLRIARTIADLEGSEDIKTAHVAEAASFRFLDRMSI